MHIELGVTSQQGYPAGIDLQELLSTRLLVQGNSGSGKSHLLRRLLEQSAPHVQQAIVDPEGDFVSLADAFGHFVIDASELSEAAMREVAARVRQHRISVVLNLEHLEVELQMRQAAAFLSGMFDIERAYWHPALVVVDEAQLFAPAATGEVSEDARRVSLAAMTNLMCRGRKRGLAGIIATQRLAKLAKNVAAEASNFLMGRTFLDIDMIRAADLLGIERRQAEAFRDLQPGHFIGLGPAIARRPLPMRIGSVQTRSYTAGATLTPLPEIEGNARDLLFSRGQDAPPAAAKVSLASATPAASLLQEIARARPVAAPVAVAAALAEPEASPSPAAADVPCPSPPVAAPSQPDGGGLDAVLGELLSDPSQMSGSAATLYETFLQRCRDARVNGRLVDLATFRLKLAIARAGIDAETQANPEWPKVIAAAAAPGMAEDAQGLWLLLAAAALAGQPCPDDERIAQACGTASTRRARSILDRLVQDGTITVTEAVTGRRTITITAYGWSTAAALPTSPALRAWR